MTISSSSTTDTAPTSPSSESNMTATSSATPTGSTAKGVFSEDILNFAKLKDNFFKPLGVMYANFDYEVLAPCVFASALAGGIILSSRAVYIGEPRMKNALRGALLSLPVSHLYFSFRLFGSQFPESDIKKSMFSGATTFALLSLFKAPRRLAINGGLGMAFGFCLQFPIDFYKWAKEMKDNSFPVPYDDDGNRVRPLMLSWSEHFQGVEPYNVYIRKLVNETRAELYPIHDELQGYIEKYGVIDFDKVSNDSEQVGLENERNKEV